VRGQAVYFPLGDADRVRALDGSANAVSLMAGFAENSASDGSPVVVRHTGLTSLFAGLTPGVQYFVYNAGPPVPLALVPTGAMTRSVGGATNSTTVLVDKGIVLQKGSAMPSTPAAIENASGAIVVDTNANSFRTAIAGAIINPFTAIYSDGALVYPLDGTLANAQKYIGVSDGGTYAIGATVTYAPPGVALSGLVGLTPGDYFAKEDGSLVPFTGVGSTKYTRLVLDAQSATEGVVVDGPIIQRP